MQRRRGHERREEIYYVWVGERKMSRVREESNSRRVCARGPEQPVSHMGS